MPKPALRNVRRSGVMKLSYESDKGPSHRWCCSENCACRSGETITTGRDGASRKSRELPQSMIRKSMPSDLIRGWVPVSPRDKREAFARRPCSNKKIERDDDSKKSHPDLEAGRQRRCPIWVIRDRLEPAASPAISAVPPKAEVNSELHRLPDDILSAVGGHLHASPIFFRTLSNPVSWNVASWLGPRPSNTLIFSRAPSGSDRRSSVASSL